MTDTAPSGESRAMYLKRVAAHTYIDALVAVGPDRADGWEHRLQLVMGQFLDAVPVISHGDDLTLSLEPLLYGAIELLQWLTDTLTVAAGASYEDVITDLRQLLHDHEASGD